MLATAGSAEGGVLHSTELMLLVMGTSMALPMAALMRYRRHGWPATLRMSAVMYLGLALPLPALWVGALGAGGVMVVGHVLMLALMLVEMLRHGEEYAGRHHEAGTRLGAHPGHAEQHPQRTVRGGLEPPVDPCHVHHPRLSGATSRPGRTRSYEGGHQPFQSAPRKGSRPDMSRVSPEWGRRPVRKDDSASAQAHVTLPECRSPPPARGPVTFSACP